ncbi:MAG: cysteine--tRNA ligase [Actinomycetota bacterium]
MRLYDTLAREIVDVRPERAGLLSMYSCGPTVYRYAHIGNMRTFLMADLIRRAFELAGTEVRQIQNITDVGHMTDELFDRGEDKMLVAAGIENKTPEEIAAYYTDAFYKDIQAVGIKPAALYPKASDHIPQMIELITKLIERGHAYEAGGTVYYDVRSFPAYGRLSGNTLDSLQSGHRKDVDDENKRHHADFVLWMSAGPRRLIKFASPWGDGYPGWHIECSALSMQHLGDRFDLHTGGEDNVFPHHEDEIAQSEGVVGRAVVRHWVHGAHLLSEGRKMAKSAENFYELGDLEARGHTEPLAIRLLFLQSRYRAQMNFTLDALGAAETTLARWRRLIGDWSADGSPPSDVEQKYEQRFADAIDDDLDTPSAVALSAEVVSTPALSPAGKVRLLTHWDAVLGLDLNREASQDRAVPAGVARLIDRREHARAARDFAAADSIREQIRAEGYDVEDTAEGPKVRPTS